ncbi:hypothetical protein ACFLZ7_01185 [Nanoarchaeota archaeon]
MQQYQGEYPIGAEQKKLPLKMILIVLAAILVIVLAVFFITRPEAPEEVVLEEQIVEEELDINVVFASFVDDNFNYQPQPSAEYLQDRGVYIYIEVNGFKQDRDLSVDLTQDIEIRDSEGEIVFSQKGLGSLKETGIEIAKFSNAIPTLDWEPGRYFAKIVVTDNLARKSAEKILEFTIVEKSTEVIEKTLDLSGIVSENIAETNLIRQQTVWNPDGSVIPELSFNYSFVGDFAEVDLSQFNDAPFKIPERFDAGIYSIEIKYINLENGKSVSVKDVIEVKKELSVDQLVFASSIDEEYNYVAQPNSIYSVGDAVHVYMRIVDYIHVEGEGRYNVWFVQDAIILDENGNEISSRENLTRIDDVNDEKKDAYNLKNIFETNNLPSGTYTYRVIVRDINGGQETIKEAKFWLE